MSDKELIESSNKGMAEFLAICDRRREDLHEAVIGFSSSNSTATTIGMACVVVMVLLFVIARA